MHYHLTREWSTCREFLAVVPRSTQIRTSPAKCSKVRTLNTGFSQNVLITQGSVPMCPSLFFFWGGVVFKMLLLLGEGVGGLTNMTISLGVLTNVPTIQGSEKHTFSLYLKDFWFKDFESLCLPFFQRRLISNG